MTEHQEIEAEYQQACAQYDRDIAARSAREQAKVDREVIDKIMRLWGDTNSQTRDAIERLFDNGGPERPDSDCDTDPVPSSPQRRLSTFRLKSAEAEKRILPIIIAEMEKRGQKARRMSLTRFEKHFATLIETADMYAAFDAYCGQDHANEDGEWYEWDGDRWRKEAA